MPVETVPYYRYINDERYMLTSNRYHRVTVADCEHEPNLPFFAEFQILDYADGAKGPRGMEVLNLDNQTHYVILFSHFLTALKAGAVHGDRMMGRWQVAKIGATYTLTLI